VVHVCDDGDISNVLHNLFIRDALPSLFTRNDAYNAEIGCKITNSAVK
jgi:hypothetical protein